MMTTDTTTNSDTTGPAAASAATDAITWTPYDSPADLTAIEQVPLAERGLPETSYHLLMRAAKLWPTRTAVTVMPEAARWREAVSLTFADLHEKVVRAGNVLHDAGVRRTDAVALVSPNCEDLIVATLAAQLAGIASPINPGLSPVHISELLELSGARVLVGASAELDAETYGLIKAVAAQGVIDTVLLLLPTGSIPLNEAPKIEGVETVAYLSVAAALAVPAGFIGELPRANSVASMFHTGGTTGVPKLAAHTHNNEIVDAWTLAANTLLDDDSVIFAALPLFHVNALIVTLLCPLFRGQSAVWAGPAGYRDLALYGEIWHIIEHYRIASMSGVPTVYAALANCPVNADISSMRFAMVGASALPPGVRAAFEDATGIRMVEGYGLTEATCATARGFIEGHQSGTLGQRMPYQHVKAVRVDENGEWTELAHGEIGLIVIGGPTVFPGYVKGRDEAGNIVLDGLGKLRDGWLDTGDLGSVDADGWIRLSGRAKDLIIRGGHNIDPLVIEDALIKHPAVTGASAVGRPDQHSGEVPVAYVTLTPGAEVTEDDLKAWAQDHVSEATAAPKEVTVIDVLHITDVGKPNKLPLRADAARREIARALASLDGVVEVLAEVENGGTLVTVEVSDPEVEAQVAAILGQYALTWHLAIQGSEA